MFYVIMSKTCCILIDNLIILFILFYDYHIAGYLSSALCIFLLRIMDESLTWTCLYPRVSLSLPELPSPISCLSLIIDRCCFHTVHKRFFLILSERFYFLRREDTVFIRDEPSQQLTCNELTSLKSYTYNQY